ncbi:sugar kinase [Patulibacter sp. S7RM1-6]
MNAPEVVTFGEAMGLFLAPPNVPLRRARTFSRSVAGAELNVAVGLARLGHAVRWVGRVGDDAFGEDVVRTLRAEGVETRATVDPGAPTGVITRDQHAERAVEVAYHRAGSAGSRLTADEVVGALGPGVRLLHVTGITPALGEDAHAATLAAVARARELGIPVSFDPNHRARLWSRAQAAPVLQDLAEHADLVLSGADEAELVTGHRDRDPAADWFLERGARVVVLKDGAKGAWVADRHGRTAVAPHPVAHPVDPVGAGDAFAAGFLSAWLRELPAERCAREGAIVGAACVQSSGDLDGLPSRAQRDAMYDGDTEVRR